MEGEEHGGGFGGFGDNGFQMMGMMNALKTGDMHTDMIIAMCVPIVLKMIFEWMKKFEDDIFDCETWAEWWRGEGKYHERFISHSTTRNYWGDVSNADEDTQNSVLLKAIKMYLNQVVKLKLKIAHLDLTGMEDKNYDGCYDYDSDSDEEDDDSADGDDNQYGSKKTLVGMLSRYKIINRLPTDEWHVLGQFGRESKSAVRLRIINSSRQEGDGTAENRTRNLQITNTTFHFASPGEGAIDDFIDSAYKWYIDELRKLEDNSRHLYDMKLPELKIGGNNNNNNGGGDGDSSSSSGISYKRYKLSEEKTFDSLFFREKENLLNLVDHFTEKSGKYAIKGYPHKLGLLLHGPPGTGKTSLIKALAQYTGRSIVNVPLSRVSTNSELMSIFFDRKYHVEGSNVPVKLGFKDVIFVMEDVDAAAKIVKRRDGKNGTLLPSGQEATGQQINLPTPKSLWRMLLESTSRECQDLVKELCKLSDRLKKEADAVKPQLLETLAKRVTSFPALGLVGLEDRQGYDDSCIGQVCNEAMDNVNKMKEQHEKLEKILSAHAGAVKSMLESGVNGVNDAFVDELLGTTAVPSTLTESLPSRNIEEGPDRNKSFPDEERKFDDLEDDLQQILAASLSPTANDSSTNSKTSSSKSAFGGLGTTSTSLLPKRNPDALSLAGLLNVLDGVVDTPGRIVIMTTNHPEMLDPALIRPGRVDKKLLLGYMAAADIVNMLEHYFQTKLDKEQKDRVEFAVNGDGKTSATAKTVNGTRCLKLTPAQVEQLSVEYDDIEDMIVALERMSSLHP